MTYETFIEIVKKTGKVKLCDAMQLIEELYRQAGYAEDAIDEYNRIYDLFDLVLQQSVFLGDLDDYHNIAVVCARQDEYDIACSFLEKGLEKYPYGIDLLADYLKYALQCEKKDGCADVYQKLLTKKNEWNWRAYLFSVDYLISLSDMDCVNRDDEITKLIHEFQDNIPDDENAYMLEAQFLSKKHVNDNNGKSRYIEILSYVTSEESPVKRTPKCDLKLADYYYNNGMDIEKAIYYLERCKKNSVETQLSVNRNYVYLLLALCQITKYYNETDSIDDIEALAMDVYKNYHIACLDKTDTRINSCKNLIESFVRETKVAYPYDDNIDNDI